MIANIYYDEKLGLLIKYKFGFYYLNQNMNKTLWKMIFLRMKLAIFEISIFVSAFLYSYRFIFEIEIGLCKNRNLKA